MELGNGNNSVGKRLIAGGGFYPDILAVHAAIARQ